MEWRSTNNTAEFDIRLRSKTKAKATKVLGLWNKIEKSINSDSSICCLLFLGAISLAAPGLSTCPATLLMSILAFLSVDKSLGGGDGRFSEDGTAIKAGEAATADDVGFFRPLRDGGGGASSVRPCDLNLDWYVFTVAVFSVSRRISIEMEALRDMIGIDLGFCASLSFAEAVGDVLAAFDAATAGGGISLLSLSLSLSCLEDEDDDEVDDDDLRSLDELEPELLDDDDDDDEEDFEDLCLFEEEEDEPLLRSRSLLELEEPELERALSLSRYLSLELRWEEEEDEELLEELLFEEEDDEEEDDLWLDEEDL